MFGFGSNRRRGRNETFASGRLRGAALAGIGMLAWKWWRNRQSGAHRPATHQDRPFSERPTQPADQL
jgi:hypothetical protein